MAKKDKQNKNGLQATSASIIHVLQAAAKKLGATILVEPEWGCVGQVTYPSGITRYFRTSTLDLNTMGASEIARDKGYCRFFMEKMGYPIPQGKTFLSPSWARELKRPERGSIKTAWDFAKSVGLPVFVKPNSLSRGVGVSKATCKKEFQRAVREAMRKDKVIVVEKAVTGRDYRIVVLDGKVISAYERIPLSLVGDGVSTIRQLLQKTEKAFAARGQERSINRKDFRLLTNLRRMKLNFDSVLEAGCKVKLLDNANLSSGGTSADVTQSLHKDYKNLVEKISHDMGLRLVGVDLMVHGTLSTPPRKGHYWIIEINSAPGLDHYASMGAEQNQIVEDLYFQVLKAMERPHEKFRTAPTI